MISFKGVFTALITPFQNGEVDYESFENLVHFQKKGGVQGLVINGTTGESPSLNSKEVEALYKKARKIVGEGFPIILGTGSNNHTKTLLETQKAKSLGVDGALVVVPYYNKPTQQGLIEHYEKLAQTVPKLPILLYNVPSRTITSLEKKTIQRLSLQENIVGVKEATGNIDFGQSLLHIREKSWFIVSGDDFTFLDLVLQGGSGVISVISNILPKAMTDLYCKAKVGDSSVSKEYTLYSDLLDLLYCESNPIPIKMALHQMGIINSPELRLPLVEMTNLKSQELKSNLQSLGLL